MARLHSLLQAGTGTRAVRKRKTAAWSDDGSAADSSGEQGEEDGDDVQVPAAASGASAAVAGAASPFCTLVGHVDPASLYIPWVITDCLPLLGLHLVASIEAY